MTDLRPNASPFSRAQVAPETKPAPLSQDRARQCRRYDLHVCTVIPFHRTKFGKR